MNADTSKHIFFVLLKPRISCYQEGYKEFIELC